MEKYKKQKTYSEELLGESDKPTADQLIKLYNTKGADALRVMINMDQKRFSRMLSFAGGDIYSLIQDYVGESANEEYENKEGSSWDYDTYGHGG